MLGFDALGRIALGATGQITTKGAASQTVAGVTQASTGALKIQAAAAQTVAAVTQASTGALRVSAQVGGTTAAITQVATATNKLVGDGSTTIGNVTSTATATLLLQASASQALGDVTSSTVSIVQLDPSGGGGFIAGGHFSRGQWRKLKDEQEARRLAALNAEKRRKQQIVADALARKAKDRAAVLAQREVEARATEQAELQRLLAGAQNVATGTQTLQSEFGSAANVQRMIADAIARQKAEQDDEDEAIALLMLAA